MAHEGRAVRRRPRRRPGARLCRGRPVRRRRGRRRGQQARHPRPTRVRATGSTRLASSAGRRPSGGPARRASPASRDREMEGAAASGLTIKLLATATRRRPTVASGAVVPTAVPADSPFGRTDGVTQPRRDRRCAARDASASPGPGPVARRPAAPSSATSSPSPAVAPRRGPGCRRGGPCGRGRAPLDGAATGTRSCRPSATGRDAAGGTRRGGLGHLRGRHGHPVRMRPLAEVRAAFASILPDGVDVTLYPVDD